MQPCGLFLHWSFRQECWLRLQVIRSRHATLNFAELNRTSVKLRRRNTGMITFQSTEV